MRMILRNLVVCSTVVLLAGCPASAPPTPARVANEPVDHENAHDHAHAQPGPNGGHLIELGNEEFHVEWTHDDQAGVVTLYVLDAAATTFVPVAADAVTVTAKVGEATDYKLAAVEPIGDPPVSAKFQLKSPELIECLKLAGQGAEVSVALTIDGNAYRGEFEHHDHGHGHHH